MTSTSWILCGALLLVGSAAQAQQRTMAMYGDWTLSCATAAEAGNAKSCGLVQIQKFGNQASASQLGIGRNKSAQPFRISIEVPADVWMPAGVKLATGDNAPMVSAQFKWCVSTRCLADAELTDSDIRTLRAQKAPGKITYKVASQSDVNIPVTFNGFSEAFDALQKQ
jgi:invasion protein IalB